MNTAYMAFTAYMVREPLLRPSPDQLSCLSGLRGIRPNSRPQSAFTDVNAPVPLWHPESGACFRPSPRPGSGSFLGAPR